MLKSSRCSVVFPTNGLALSGEITFQPGVTAVVGRNGTGKTFKTIELWRYLLFGKKALRGPASDYKKLEAEGVVEIKGVEYLIKRTPKTEGLYQGDETLAVGADAVNKKVIELLGFGLEVFDITNASVQKQSNRLTQLTPAKRKELIDEVCGLAQNEKAEKDCKEKAKLLKLEADVIRDNMAPLIEPTKPNSYRPSAELQKELSEARAVERERSRLVAIATQTLAWPASPEKQAPSLEEIENHEAERLKRQAAIATLEQVIANIPVTTYTAEEVRAGQAWVQYDAEISRRGPKPEISEEEADDAINLFNRIQVLKSINMAVECPACQTLFTPSRELPDAPEKELNYYYEQNRRTARWTTPLEEPSGARIPHDKLQIAHAAIARAKDREAALADLKALTATPLADRSVELAEARDLVMHWELYNAAMGRCREDERRKHEAEKLLADLPPAVDVGTLDAAFVAARIYESQLERYEQDKVTNLDKMAKIRDLNTEAEDFLKGAKRLVEARREVKGYLAPSLSRIASVLITDMTCGKLNQVFVDEDMNVTVDGQDVATLSGAGETAANLALRLALGRTLVGGVFPVFLGDEIDADADEERSEATFECLRNLKNQFAQVIIITHKPHVTADHVIDLDD